MNQCIIDEFFPSYSKKVRINIEKHNVYFPPVSKAKLKRKNQVAEIAKISHEKKDIDAACYAKKAFNAVLIIPK